MKRREKKFTNVVQIVQERGTVVYMRERFSLERRFKMEKNIMIVWAGSYDFDTGNFSPAASVEFKIMDYTGKSDIELCEAIYQETNRYSGTYWEIINEVGLPSHRSHTALSVHLGPIVNGNVTEFGDSIFINDEHYEVQNFGWKHHGKVVA